MRYDIWMKYYKESIFYEDQEYYGMMAKSLNRTIDYMRIPDILSVLVKRLMRKFFIREG
jgi:hypothetical protein